MHLPPPPRHWRKASALVLPLILSACQSDVMNPAGDIAKQQAHLVVVATLLMLIIVVPVMVLIAVFAFKYRAGANARYEPEWHHSTQLELVIWSAPLLIIIALGSLTWVTTHLLDPFRPLDRIKEGQPVKAGTKPLEIEVVALDWKWLFIYPEQGVASINEVALPVDRPVHFSITASSVMNSFYIPAVAGQIYAMPGMTTQLNAVVNKAGSYNGFSANYSGAGFSHMHFTALGLAGGDFDKWVANAKSASDKLDAETYLKVEQPSGVEATDPVRHFANVQGGLFDRIVNLCVTPGKMCVNQMMALDAKGGVGKAGTFNMAQLTYDKDGRPKVTPIVPGKQAELDKAFVRALCDPAAKVAGPVLPAGQQSSTPEKAHAKQELSLLAPARSTHS
ncbi:MAG: ubiquinol oxidase subunit II [Sphingomonadales bacterium]|nr:ubiquinol oxidase subunit II [Sphingomonadales bacterium]MDE2168491.1 ubiquinol oxidase subunit II [Sphingomonadales bacterium]